ncbi:MAG: Branched-chain amino acid transporter, amino acid-binding protein [Phycisphaerales bacterium]|nr:Branched-chain amino acid transporter, amino acid-binding protein [Phycisphaerales bacterium]
MRNRLTAALLAAAAVPALVAGLLLPAAGCNRQSGGAGANAATIVVGQVASMTGGTATFGVSSDEGLRLALDEVNAAGGVLGKKVEVKTEDDASVPDQAKTAANKLLTRDKVVALIGEISSSRSIAMAPEAEAAGIPMLSPGSTNPKVTQQGEFIFRSCYTDTFQGKAIATFALKDLKLKRFAVLFPINSDYGTGLRDFITAAVKAGGGEVVATESYTESQDVSFTSQLTKIKGANPEAIFVTGYYVEAGLIAKQAKELGLAVPLLGCDGFDSDQTVKIGGPAVNGSYFSNHYAAEETRPEVKAFVDAYRAKYKNPDGSPKTPDAMAVLGYDAMKLMADAIKRAKSTDPKAIRDALAATKDFPGASGVITIDAERNAKKPIVILKIEDGKFKHVSTIKPE